MRIYVGTYERFVLGYEFKTDENEEYACEELFTNNSSLGIVKTVAVSQSGKMLAAGGTDEMVWLFDLKRNQELGNVIPQCGTILKLQFCDSDHTLIAASSDGLVVIDTKSWSCVKNFPIVNLLDAAIHHSNRLAVTADGSRFLRTWNLCKGSQIHSLRLKSGPTLVTWSPCGTMLTVISKSYLDFRNIETGDRTAAIQLPGAVHCAEFLSKSLLICGLSGSNNLVLLSTSGKVLFEMEAHKNRTKAITVMSETQFISVGSDGFIKLWKYENSSFKLLTQVNTKCRLTSVCGKIT